MLANADQFYGLHIRPTPTILDGTVDKCPKDWDRTSVQVIVVMHLRTYVYIEYSHCSGVMNNVQGVYVP